MKNRITVILALLLGLVMLVSLVACGGDDKGKDEGTTTPAATTTEAPNGNDDPVDEVTTTAANVEDEEPEETETGLQFADDNADLGFGDVNIAP